MRLLFNTLYQMCESCDITYKAEYLVYQHHVYERWVILLFHIRELLK